MTKIPRGFAVRVNTSDGGEWSSSWVRRARKKQKGKRGKAAGDLGVVPFTHIARCKARDYIRRRELVIKTRRGQQQSPHSASHLSIYKFFSLVRVSNQISSLPITRFPPHPLLRHHAPAVMTPLASRPLVAKIHCSANDVMAHQWRCIVRITIVRTVWNCGLFTTTHLESRHTLGPLPEGDEIAEVSSEIRCEEQWENSLKRELRPQGEQAGGRRRGKAAGDLGVVCFTHIERYKVRRYICRGAPLIKLDLVNSDDLRAKFVHRRSGFRCNLFGGFRGKAQLHILVHVRALYQVA
ncbi:hypothetical protein B0H16DRAFT_1480252 [Mycena metata]|uniref:Uncharacterized protein n=1 Tax=Mycena metata TaxID=1033252 RepID=A0AAD7MDP3_9AGAR|nr:hypothetical protein B0H16DRAFT_1480252 [Mycena metata]